MDDDEIGVDQQQPDPHRQNVEVEEEQPAPAPTVSLEVLFAYAGELADRLGKEIGLGHYADARASTEALAHILDAVTALDGSRLTA